jgi:hypothetical protein
LLIEFKSKDKIKPFDMILQELSQQFEETSFYEISISKESIGSIKAIITNISKQITVMTSLIHDMRSLMIDESGKTLRDDNDQKIEDLVAFEKFLM